MPVPNVSYKVEIAWTSNWRTPAASRVWTDVSDYVELHEGIGIEFGRSDELATADANQLTLTLDNSDGRFTWGNASSPYFPNVVLNKPIRVTAIVGVIQYVRFVGFINQWPVEWPGDSSGYASAQITASSRLARLGRAPAESMPSVSAAVRGASGFWPLTDPSASTEAADAITPSALGALVPRGRGTVAFAAAVGPEAQESYGPLFSGGALEAEGSLTDTGIGVGFWLKTASASAGGQPVRIFTTELGGMWAVQVRITTTNTVFEFGSPSTTITRSVALLNDDVSHHVFASIAPSGGNVVTKVYVDGVLVDTSTTADPGGLAFIGGISLGSGSWPADLTSTFTGTIHNLILFTGAALLALDDTAVAELAADATSTAYAGETTGDRIRRLAEWAGISTTISDLVVGGGDIEQEGVPAEPAKIVDLMRRAETTEAGVLFDSQTGVLTFQPRSARYRSALGFEVPFTSDRVGGYKPVVDLQQMVNVGKGRNRSGTVEATYTDEASREEHGDGEYTVETDALDPTEPLQLVAAAVNAYAEPRPRAPQLNLSVIDWIIGGVTGVAGSMANLMSLTIGSRVRLLAAPSQSPSAGSADYFLEGYSEEIGVGSWSITPNLSPSWPADSVFVLNDSTFGELDSDNLIAL